MLFSSFCCLYSHQNISWVDQVTACKKPCNFYLKKAQFPLGKIGMYVCTMYYVRMRYAWALASCQATQVVHKDWLASKCNPLEHNH